jgi:hypothetical protein
MLCTGLSAVIGSWKIMPMRLPRISHICASVSAVSSRPSKRMLPMISAFSGKRPISAITVIVFPQPDSPTTPSVSPRSRLKLTSRTA